MAVGDAGVDAPAMAADPGGAAGPTSGEAPPAGRSRDRSGDGVPAGACAGGEGLVGFVGAGDASGRAMSSAFSVPVAKGCRDSAGGTTARSTRGVMDSMISVLVRSSVCWPNRRPSKGSSPSAGTLLAVQAVAAVPAEGVTPVAPFNTSADGTQLTFNAQVAAGAASGPRVLRITTPAGVSSEVGTPANTVTIAQQTAGAVTPIASSLVGVQVGDSVTAAPTTAAALFQAAPVGVVVNTLPEPATRVDTPRASPVGVVIGSAAQRVAPASPDGLLKGTSASVVVHGVGLSEVNGVALTGSGVTAGAPVTNTEGTQLTVTLTAAADAPSGAVGLRLLAPAAGGGTAAVPTADGSALSVHVGQLPERLDSISPIVIEQGKAVTLTVRGVGLRDVFAVAFEPSAGVSIPPGGAVTWSSDSFGERLVEPTAIRSCSH